jgi:cation-transporting ATPase 13A3/4/5
MRSDDILPGDIIKVHSNKITIFPCDAVLFQGDCIMDESMLTGETVPVPKIIMDNKHLVTDDVKTLFSSDKHILFHGTKLIKNRNDTVAIVLRTGFNTSKGQLIRSILFPKPMVFKFYSDSIKFIGVLAVIAFFGFILAAYNFIRLGNSWGFVFKRSLDLITIVVPPALPATLSIGVTYAIRRLRSAGVSCIAPSKINVGGKLNSFCFDKTGTITEDGLHIHGIQSIHALMEEISEDGHSQGLKSFSEFQQKPNSDQVEQMMSLIMAACHSLREVNTQIVGDPIDLIMYEASGFVLEEPPFDDVDFTPMKVINKNEFGKVKDIHIIKKFEFNSKLRRISAIVGTNPDQKQYVFTKGAPESIISLCTKGSIPANFDKILNEHTRNGYRVIACAYKPYDNARIDVKREEVERDLLLVGLIILENRIKGDAIKVLEVLNKAKFFCVMSTGKIIKIDLNIGDNILTAVTVARHSGFVPPEKPVFVSELDCGSVRWVSIDNPEQKAENVADSMTLAMTGECLDHLFSEEAMARDADFCHQLLCQCKIYARMSPDQKNHLVERLQGIGFSVGMCGDGANDCGALKLADVGISLSEADASVAAPFTSKKVKDIAGVIDVIKEGRAALVTSFSCFKYMALYSLIQFSSVSLLYFFGSGIGDLQFLYTDLFLVLPLAIVMGRAAACDVIVPKRPTASLLSQKVLVSVVGHFLFQLLAQTIVYFWVQYQIFYEPRRPAKDTKNTPSYENSAVFLFANYLYLIYAFVFSIGYPYRRSLKHNPLFLFWSVFSFGTNTILFFIPAEHTTGTLNLVHLGVSFKFGVIGLVFAYAIGCYFLEQHVFPFIGKRISRRLKQNRPPTKIFKQKLKTGSFEKLL